MPASASGRSTAMGLSPRIRTDRPMTQTAIGGLSMVMKLPASIEPKNIALQLWLAAWAAAE